MKEAVPHFQELRRLTAQCPKCNSQMILKYASNPERHGGRKLSVILCCSKSCDRGIWNSNADEEEFTHWWLDGSRNMIEFQKIITSLPEEEARFVKELQTELSASHPEPGSTSSSIENGAPKPASKKNGPPSQPSAKSPIIYADGPSTSTTSSTTCQHHTSPSNKSTPTKKHSCIYTPPENKHIKPKIRQRLQILRNIGLIGLKGEGIYKLKRRTRQSMLSD